MSKRKDVETNPTNAKVLQLGFNISVSGDPGTDFEIVLDDKKKIAGQDLSQTELENSEVPQLLDSNTELPKNEIEISQEAKTFETTGTIPKHKKQTTTESTIMSDNEKSSSTSSKEFSIINEIKSTMEHFEKFSDHIKEIPRLKNRPVATSTPFSDKYNSKSESNLLYSEYKPRRFANLYDFSSRRDYFRGSVKPLPPDLFLKPLPGENFYRRGIVNRYFDHEPSKHYGSVDSLSKNTKPKYDFENETSTPGILKKSDSESGDKFSTSSAESVKDIKIYQSGGILIMQNFKDNIDANERKEISDFSAKLIENCNKLREEVNSGFPNVEEKIIITPVEESKNSVKMVQFDLSGTEHLKSKSSESSYNALKDDSLSSRIESSGSHSDIVKTKEPSPQGTPQSQDLTSLSTQENDSILSNQPGMSPTLGAAKKLEWDSGADVGYLNLDLSKENLSTIERIVLKGLSSDGVSEKKVVYEKKPEQPPTNRSRFILERMPSELVLEEILEDNKESGKGDNKEKEVEKSETEEIPHVMDEQKKQFQSPKTKKSAPSETTKPQEAPKAIQEDEKPKRKNVDLTDKSVNVNTLFKDSDTQVTKSEEFKIVENPKFRSSRLSPKVKKLRKKRLVSQKPSLTAPLKEKIDTIIDIARYSARSNEEPLDMGIPKRVYKKMATNSDLNEIELSRDVEEIVIDQRFKIKQNLAIGKGSLALTDKDRKEIKPKSIPVSASSSSNNTVLPNIEVKIEEKKSKEQESKFFADQIIQTNESKVESVGIQAFASQQSSDYDFKVRSKDRQNIPKILKNDGINTSSKNIQAFGLNSSLPKELAHPKESNLPENQNTKSTQFFGGPINSLPNYHSNLITKPVESCSRMPKVLKTRKNLAAEIIRLREENQKNIMANDLIPVKDTNDVENKENLITDTMSKKSQTKNSNSNGSSMESNKREIKSRQTTEKENPSTASYQRPDTVDVEKEVSSVESSLLAEKEKPSVGSCQTSEISSQVLTTEALKEHGGSIDKNIIKEKYFQSQLLELAKRDMISKSTSMERVNEGEGVTVGCQYSPQPKESRSSSTKSKTAESSLQESKRRGKGKKQSTDAHDSKQNIGKDNSTRSTIQDQDFQAGDSLPSSTQTAHSWIPGMEDSEQNDKSGVGRARSFEYLPGHVYESSGNLREVLLSDTERNVITCSSSRSSNTEMGKGSISDGRKNSEGRSTLVLENSTDNSVEFGPMKILDENLTQLNLVVSKLWEKDAKVQSITQSLLVNLWKKNGSGDCSQTLGASESPKTDVFDNVDTSNGIESRKDSGDAYSELKCRSSQKRYKEQEMSTACQEMSTACQTEDKLPSPELTPEKILEEKTILEKRISREKENQIKWIENEIHHLNLLRELLGKQNSSQRRKKHSPLSITVSSDDNVQKSLISEVPEILNSAYNCTPEPEDVTPTLAEGDNIVENQNRIPISDGVKYGMAVSFSEGVNHLRKIVMLPVGVQVSSKEKTDIPIESDEEEVMPSAPRPSVEGKPESRRPSSSKAAHLDENTQFPSRPRSVEQLNTTSVQTSFLSRCTCRKEACLCREFSEKSCESGNLSGKSKNSDRRDSLRLSFACDDYVRENIDVGPTGRHNLSSPSRRASAIIHCIDKPLNQYERPNNQQNQERINYQLCPEKVNNQQFQERTNNQPYQERTNNQQYQERTGNHPYQERTNNQQYQERSNSLQYQERPNNQYVERYNNQYMDRPNSANPYRKPNHMVTYCKGNMIESEGGRVHKSGVSCQNHYESNIYLKYETPIDTNDIDATPRPEPQKATLCACPVIKIHAPACCSSDVNPSVKSNQSKLYEHQSSQTDELKERDYQDVGYDKNYTERQYNSKKPEQSPGADNKPRQRGCCCEKKQPRKNCICPKSNKRNQKDDDIHPRHYFLKIEEKESDEYNLLSDPKKNVEVITVTVPVKKGEKNRKQYKQPQDSPYKNLQDSPYKQPQDPIYKHPQDLPYKQPQDLPYKQPQDLPYKPSQDLPYKPSQDLPYKPSQDLPYKESQDLPYKPSQDLPFKQSQDLPYKQTQDSPYGPPSNSELVNTFSHSDCKCCEECLVRLCEKITQQFESQTKTQYRRYAAEKPQSPKVVSHQSLENDSFHNENTYMNARDCYYDASNTLPSYSQESCQNDNSAGNLRSDPYAYDNYEVGKCVENCNCCNAQQRPPFAEEPYTKNTPVESHYGYKEQQPIKFSDPVYEPNPRQIYGNYTQDRKRFDNDYYNYNKQEYMTKSELTKEKEKKKKTYQPSLQEFLATNRPDFYYNAESRRRALGERAKERTERYNNRLECLMNLMHYCNEKHPPKFDRTGKNRLFTTAQMKQLTMKRYRNLPEVTGKIADQKKKQQYKTNKIMADIFAKKLQTEVLKGRINLSNSVSILSTI